MSDPAAPEANHPPNLRIKIDRKEYTVHDRRMTGAELRSVPTPPIPTDRDLFEVVPGGSDRKIDDDTVVEIHDGLRFISVPAHINPGRRPRAGAA
jgi:hypothetical protein